MRQPCASIMGSHNKQITLDINKNYVYLNLKAESLISDSVGADPDRSLNCCVSNCVWYF